MATTAKKRETINGPGSGSTTTSSTSTSRSSDPFDTGSTTSSYNPNSGVAGIRENKSASKGGIGTGVSSPGSSRSSTGSSRNTSSTVSNATAALNQGQIRSSPDVYDQQSALQSMKQNSQDWLGASSANQNMLARENASLANAYFPGATRDSNGVWWYNGQKLYDMDFSNAGGNNQSLSYPVETPIGTLDFGNLLDIGMYDPFDQGSDYPYGADLLEQQNVGIIDNPYYWEIIQRMKGNSAQWNTASPENQKKLAAENRELAKQIPGAYIGNDGVWYLNGQKLYDMQYQQPVIEMPEFEYVPFEQTAMGQQLMSNYQDLLSKVQNYDAFSYDPETDPTYLQYADSYTRGGQRAMTDVLGQLAARTGGLASSYAGSMAQQTYDQYMTDLANKIPELRQLAYSMYVDDYNRQVNDYNRAYQQYADAYGRYMDDTQFQYGRYQDELANEWKNLYNKQDQQQQALDNYRSAMSWQNTQNDMSYQRERDAIADQRYEQEWEYQKQQDEYNRQQAQAERQAQARSELYDRVRNGYVPTQEDAARYGLSATELAQLQSWAREQNRQENSRYYAYYGY